MLLTEDEASLLMRDAIEGGNMQHVELKTGDSGLTDARLRDSTRCVLVRQELADKMFERLRTHLDAEVVVDGEESSRLLGLPAGDEELHGVWRPCGCNPQIRVAKYPGDGRGHFGPHQDGAIELSPNTRSLLTINGYLNTVPEGMGGCTRFLIDDLPMYKDERGRFTVEDPATSVRGAIRPTLGTAAVFYHGLMHDSEPLAAGSPPKWIFRTEVLYERTPESAPMVAPETETARRIERSAERVERDDPMRAMQLYQVAQRLRDGRTSVDSARRRAHALLPDEEGHGGGGDTDEENDGLRGVR